MVRMVSAVRFRRGLHKSLASGNAGQFRVWRPVELAMPVAVAFGVPLDRRMPDGEHFPG
jgi:hypothetical protein